MDKISSSLISFFLSSFIFYSLLFVVIVRKADLEILDADSYVEIDFLSLPKTQIEQNTGEQKNIEEEGMHEEIKEVKKKMVDDLFAQSDVKEVVEELRNYKYELKEIDTKKAKLNFSNPSKKEMDLGFKPSGTKSINKLENEYLKILQENIYSIWETSPEDAGKKAWIIFAIAKDGSFSYYIKSISSGDNFRYRLKQSLDLLKQKKLPPPKDNIRVNVHFIAKE